MRRRNFLAAVGVAGAVGTAGCGAAGSHTVLANPAVVHSTSDGTVERTLEFEAGGDPLADLGMRASVAGGTVRAPTQCWHRDGTKLTGVELRIRTPGTDAAPTVRHGSPERGNVPESAVSVDRAGSDGAAVVEIADLGDLRDETATVELVVEPAGSVTPTTLVTDGAVRLTEGEWFGDSYTLEGSLRFEFPA